MLELVPPVLALLALATPAPRLPAGPLAEPHATAAQDELQRALDAFLRSATQGLEERRAALAALVELGDFGALPTLLTEFAQTSSKLRRTRDELDRDRVSLEHQRRTYELLQLSARRDSTLASTLEKQERRLGDMTKAVEIGREKLEEVGAWYAALTEGATRYFEALPASKRKQAEKELWKEAEEASDLGRRLAAVELLGHAGGDGTALELQGLVDDLASERKKLARELPRELAELRKLEARWQREMDQLGGASSRASETQYDRAKRRAAELQAGILQLGHLADGAAEAGARALARETPESREKSVAKLARAQAKAEEGARARTLRLLGLSRVDSALAALRAIAVEENEPGARAAAVDALAAAGDEASVPLLLARLVEDPSWNVRSRAAHALAVLRSRDAIPVLVDRLAVESGRLKSDLREALVSLTGRDFRTNVELWRRFWAEHGEGFVVPEADELALATSEEAKESVGVTFFGIETESERVLFVLDLSRSMTFSMVPRRHPQDEDPGDPDMPQEGEISRLTAAKRALSTALGGIDDGAVFNMVFYATDVWTWQDRLVEMDAEMRSDAQRYVEALDANGGTNVYGALQMALELAEARGGDEWHEPAIDTIYFLSDGRASIGVSTDPDEILGLVRERNSSAGIVIHTIGLSGAQDAYFLRSLAEQNGGTYVSR